MTIPTIVILKQVNIMAFPRSGHTKDSKNGT